MFKPASAIVNEVPIEELTDDPCPSFPKPVNLAKAANHLRQRLRLANPVDLEFELQLKHIPENSFRGDIKVSILQSMCMALLSEVKKFMQLLHLYFHYQVL